MPACRLHNLSLSLSPSFPLALFKHDCMSNGVVICAGSNPMGELAGELGEGFVPRGNQGCFLLCFAEHLAFLSQCIPKKV